MASTLRFAACALWALVVLQGTSMRLSTAALTPCSVYVQAQSNGNDLNHFTGVTTISACASLCSGYSHLCIAFAYFTTNFPTGLAGTCWPKYAVQSGGPEPTYTFPGQVLVYTGGKNCVGTSLAPGF